MKRFAVLGVAVGLLCIIGALGPGSLSAAETHSNCITFDANGNLVGLTPNCSQTIAMQGGTGFSFPGTNPCTGDTGTVSFAISHQVYHINVNGAGDAWDSGTDNGTATWVPDNAGAPTGQGSWVSWFGDSFNAQNTVNTFTFTFVIHFSNGQTATMHEVGHVTFTPNGPAVSFDKPTGGCN